MKINWFDYKLVVYKYIYHGLKIMGEGGSKVSGHTPGVMYK